MGFNQFDPDICHAQNHQSKLRDFIDAFEPQDAYSVCEQLIRDETKRLKSGEVDKEPEIFTQENLICPCLRALGYELRTHPGELIKTERKKPDIRLTNLGDEHVGIVECKALNRERNGGDAFDSLEERYLEENAFARYKKSLDQQYLVGIGTDGFDWEIRVKDLETGERLPEYKAQHSLVDDSKALRHFYYDRYEGDTNYSDKDWNEWRNIRDRLAKNFVSNFGIHNLPGEV